MSSPEVNNPVILFDGLCNLCNGAVNFIIRRDPSATFRFAPVQSDAAKNLMARFDLSPDDFDSVILVEDSSYFVKSTAALRICKKLKALWPLLYAFIIIPKPIRDYIYEFVANNRYKWFGKREQCMVPNMSIEGRFLN